MKNILVFLTLIIVGLVKAQSFEGTLTYVCDFEISAKMINLGLSKESLMSTMKAEGAWVDTIRTTYKKGNYLSVLNNKSHSKILYRADSNKIYSWDQPMDSSICTLTDASMDLDQTLSGKAPVISLPDTIVVVNGISCSVVRIKWKSGTYEYYYNKTLYPMLATYYEKHICEGWFSFLSISNALPIMLMKKTKNGMNAILTLVSAKAENINDNSFDAPLLEATDTESLLPNQKVMRLITP